MTWDYISNVPIFKAFLLFSELPRTLWYPPIWIGLRPPDDNGEGRPALPIDKASPWQLWASSQHPQVLSVGDLPLNPSTFVSILADSTQYELYCSYPLLIFIIQRIYFSGLGNRFLNGHLAICPFPSSFIPFSPHKSRLLKEPVHPYWIFSGPEGQHTA